MSFESASNHAEYQQFLKLQKVFKVYYKGVNLAEACGADIIGITVNGEHKDLYHIACELLKRVDAESLKEAFGKGGSVCSYGVKGRKDHEKLSMMISQSIEGNERVVLKYKYKIGALARLPKYLRIVRKGLKCAFKEQLFVASQMAAYSKVIDDLDKAFAGTDLSGKSYIPFCAPAYTEALLTLYLKNKGVRTYCTLHGNFGRYKNKIANDVVNGANITSDYVLTFGETQRNDLIRDFGMDGSRIFAAGNPKYPKKEIRMRNEYKRCVIIGGISLYDKDLAELFPVAKEAKEKLGISFALRLHPLSAITKEEMEPWKDAITLLDNTNTINEMLGSGEYDFAITHNTATYYECMYYGVKPLRWGRNENLGFERLDDKFNNFEEFENIINKSKQKRADEISQEAENLLVNVFGMGINRYNEYINGTKQDETSN